MPFPISISRRLRAAVPLTGFIVAVAFASPAQSQVDTTILMVTVDFCYPIANCKLNGGQGDMLAMTKTEYTAAGMQCINQVQDVQGPKSTSRQLDISSKASNVSGGAKPTDVLGVFTKSAQLRSQIKPCLEISDGASGRWEYTVAITWAG